MLLVVILFLGQLEIPAAELELWEGWCQGHLLVLSAGDLKALRQNRPGMV